MLIACYNVYNESKYLPKSVESVYDHVGKIVFVDGRYKGFYEDRPVASADGMLQWIKDKKNDPEDKFHLIKAPKKPWENQAQKRSAYLIGEKGDVYLYIDGHEIVTEWRKMNLFLDEIGFARLDLPEESPPKSVKVPRLIAHQEGLKYHTHTILTKGDGDAFYCNLGWDQQTIGGMKDFWQRVPVESCSMTIKHIGLQKKGMEQRQEQVKEERSKVEVLDHRQGLNFKGDAHQAVERFTKKMHESWARYAQKIGWGEWTYDDSKWMVAQYAPAWEKRQQVLRQTGQHIKMDLSCRYCGYIAHSMNELVGHIGAEHKGGGN